IEERISDVRNEATISALVLREDLSHILDQINALHGLASLVTKSRRIGDRAMEQAAQAELDLWHGKMKSGVVNIGGIGPNGYLDWINPETDLTPVYLGDREHFEALASGREQEVVGQPVIGRASKRRSIHFSKSVRAPDGTFLGATVVAIDPEMLSGLADVMGLHGANTITILRRDGIILARSGAPPAVGLPNVRETAHLRMFLDATSGITEDISPVDGLKRVVAWQRLDEAGLILVVALDRDAGVRRLQPTLERVHRWIGFTIVLICITGLGSLAIVRWRRRVAVAEAQSAMMRESESLFRQMAESLPDLIRLLDRDGKVIYASSAARDILGVEPESLLGKTSSLYVHPEDRAKMITPGPADQAVGGHHRNEIRMIRPDGKIIWLQTDMRTICGGPASARAAMVVSASRDITPQREAEMALRHAKEELDAMLTATGAVLFRTRIDDDGSDHFLFVSDSAEHLIGYTAAEIIDTPNWFANHFDPAFAQAEEAHFSRVRTEGSSRIKYRLRHRDGHWLWVSVFHRRVEGKGLTVVGTATDVTREHDREVQLAQSAKMALLGEMTTGMAHELNQPLAAIGMIAENSISLLYHHDKTNDLVRGKLERIGEQVKRAAAIINHMRVFGRKPDGAPTRVAIATAIEGAEAVLNSRLVQADIEVVSHVEPDVPPVMGHLVLLEQVLVNVIANAADAIEAHKPPLPAERRRVELRVSLASGMVDISIADQAGGIDERAMPRLFEPFFTTKPVGRGTGLGLSISYGIVTEMGGVIIARNEGDGAVFHIRLTPAAG
ncbi:MAG: PAS domain S-box protein, partial [Rhodopila sp.]|nr:PAS domain S-box protein [Rhodopila sp.]